MDWMQWCTHLFLSSHSLNRQGHGPLEEERQGQAYVQEEESQGIRLKRICVQGICCQKGWQGRHVQEEESQAIYLERIRVQGVYLEGIRVQGVYLEGIRVQGVYLEGIRVQGEYLEGLCGQQGWQGYVQEEESHWRNLESSSCQQWKGQINDVQEKEAKIGAPARLYFTTRNSSPGIKRSLEFRNFRSQLHHCRPDGQFGDVLIPRQSSVRTYSRCSIRNLILGQSSCLCCQYPAIDSTM
eukprot:scaffold10860_cov182-Amphora_coffeaeformis.AAC.7